MKRIIFVIVFIALYGLLAAQWSHNPSNPTMIAGDFGEQVMPKIAITADQYIYSSRFDNSSGSYKVWLKYYSPNGIYQWTDSQGVEMTGSISDTWLTDYDLTVDLNGNALLTFQDIRNGINNIHIYKVSPQGTQLWGESGLTLSSDNTTDFANYTPVVINTIDNNTYVAWQHSGTTSAIWLQIINPEGQVIFDDSPMSFEATGYTYSWPQLIESLDANILMKYYKDSGPFWAPTRELWLAKITPLGQIIWDIPVSNAGGITAWTQIIGFVSDGMGGAILSWHDDRDGDNRPEAFCARVASDGTLSTPLGGVSISSAIYNYYSPKVSCNPETQRIQVFCKITDGDQTQNGLLSQVLDYSGNILQGDTAHILEPLSSTTCEPLYVFNHQGTVHYFCAVGTVPNSDVNAAIRCLSIDGDGISGSTWTIPVASTNTPKLHNDFDIHHLGWVIMTWEDGSSDADIYGTKYFFNRDIGQYFGPPENLTAEWENSSGIHLNWETPLFAVADSYQIFFDYILITEVVGNLTEYTVPDVIPGTYSIFMRSLYYSDMEMSDPSNHVTLTVVANEDQLTPLASLKIYPNPIKNAAELTWQNRYSQSTSISLYNLRGQKVLQDFVPAKAGMQSYNLNTTAIPAGLYFLRLDNGEQIYSRKLILIK